MIKKGDGSGYRELLDGVRLKSLTHGERTHLTEFRLARGAVVPVHHHPHEQTGYVISGSLRFSDPDGETVVGPGDCWTFPPDAPHGAEALEDSVVIEVFSPIRDDYLTKA